MTAKQTLKKSDYVHLHNHTQYSLLDGLTKLPALFEYAKECGMQAISMTDHGTMSGAIEFYKEGKASGVKPIIGLEAYIAERSLHDKEAGKDKRYYHLILLAKNFQGYQNLMRLSTIAHLEGFYYKPRIDRETLAKYSEGLICLSGCASSELSEALIQEQYDSAIEIAKWYKSVFKDDYYLEFQDHGHKDHPSKWVDQELINKQLFKISEELKIPGVVTCDAHYLKKTDQEAHEILLCVQTGSFLTDEKRMSLKDFELHVTHPDDIIKRWGDDYPEFITNTKKIADSVNFEIELDKILIPKFPVPKGETEKSYMEKLMWTGLAYRYGLKVEGKTKTDSITEKQALKIPVPEIKKRLPTKILNRAEYELGVIESMGFCGYFLIVADFINWGKDKGIVFGPGRGSAAGSIIAYALKITELDPLQYDLLFERFLNPDRISMPDVDIDIQDSRRNEVIQYCLDKYGSDKVANIVTFGRMAARNAVRDVARVLQVPYAEADRLAKMIPPPIQGRHIPLAKSLKSEANLKAEYQNNETAKKVFDLAVQLEGTIRSHGVHAAGVVIAPKDIVSYTPLEMAQKGVVATQYAMGPIEEIGLLKMDFLGLSNLTIIKNALRIIKKLHGKDIDINKLPLDDKKTYELFQRGDTTGVFQFESAGMKRYLKELCPSEFEDIIAMGALYRPGPLSAGLTDSFIKRKTGKEKVSYDHPKMKSALQSTYGVLVYQEQFMQISREVCGFTGGEADTLRKAIGKKKRDMMKKMERRFIDGAVENGVDKVFIEKFWNQLLGFADYCFNKSHSACYGMISYQTAYLKANYPEAFMAALMTSDYDDTDRLSIEISECKNMGITVMSPDVNESFLEFAVVPETKKIRFGMKAIKNVGQGAVEEILNAREQQQFSSLEDFLSRVNPRVVNKKVIESLIKSGALDRFGERSELLSSIETLLAFAQRIQKQASSGQVDIFGNQSDSVFEAPKIDLIKPDKLASNRDRLLWERELLGLYLSQHPLDLYKTFLSEQTVPINEITPEHHGRSANVGGTITDVREISTKNGQRMAFVKIEDLFGEIELLLFPSSYQQTAGLWNRDTVVLIRGKVNSKDREGNIGDEAKILVEDAREVTEEQAVAYTATGKKKRSPKPVKKLAQESVEYKNDKPLKLYVRLQDINDQDILLRLKQTIDNYSGTTDVILVLGKDSSKQAIKLPGGIDHQGEAYEELQNLIGADNLALK